MVMSVRFAISLLGYSLGLAPPGRAMMAAPLSLPQLHRRQLQARKPG